MAECAFCDHEGKLSAEHITSQWMKPLFPGKKLAHYIDGATKAEKHFVIESVDWKAKVACGKCNSGWMSKIESEHAQPALTPLITGQVGIPIDLSRAYSIALFAFKTAVILDYAHAVDGIPFFSKRIRHAFRTSQAIPPQVNMWFCGYRDHRGGGQFKTFYHKGQISPSDHLLMYTCTGAIGYFVFKVVVVKQIWNHSLVPSGGFEGLSVPFWPAVPRDFVWPPPFALADKKQFEAFADRWRTIRLIES